MARQQLGAAPSRTADAVTVGSLLRHFMKATVGTGQGTDTAFSLGQSFATIPLNTVTYDTAGGFNTSTSIYAVALTGYYDVNATMRVNDNVGTTNFGMGVGITNSDSPTFAWYTKIASMRGTLVYAQNMKFTAGDQVRFFAYCDSSAAQSVAAASLSLSQIG